MKLSLDKLNRTTRTCLLFPHLINKLYKNIDRLAKEQSKLFESSYFASLIITAGAKKLDASFAERISRLHSFIVSGCKEAIACKNVQTILRYFSQINQSVSIFITDNSGIDKKILNICLDNGEVYYNYLDESDSIKVMLNSSGITYLCNGNASIISFGRIFECHRDNLLPDYIYNSFVRANICFPDNHHYDYLAINSHDKPPQNSGSNSVLSNYFDQTLTSLSEAKIFSCDFIIIPSLRAHFNQNSPLSFESLCNQITNQVVSNNKRLFIDPCSNVFFHERTHLATIVLNERTRREHYDCKGEILVVDSRTPTWDKDAGSLLQVQYFKILLELGYKITFVPEREFIAAGKYTEMLQTMGIVCINNKKYDHLWDYAKKETLKKFSILFLFRAPDCPHYLRILGDFLADQKIIIHTQDLHFIRERRQAETLNDNSLREKAEATMKTELEVIKKADHSIVVSSSEYSLVKELDNSISVSLIPLIAPVSLQRATLNTAKDIAFVGGFKHAPNEDACLYFCTHIFPLILNSNPNINLYIYGSEPTSSIAALSDNDNIIVHGFIEDLDAALAFHRLTVAPLRFGAGIKGKIVSSLNVGVPCVASAIAVEGMGISSDGSDGVLVADHFNHEIFAQHCLNILCDDEMWTKLAKAGPDYISKHMSYDKVKKRIESAFSFGQSSPSSSRLKVGKTYTSAVIIPLYNHAEYISESLYYIDKQTLKPTEVIILDDGSTDDSLGIVKRLSNDIEYVKVFTQENQGAHKTLNKAIELSSSEYIFVLNSDDFYLPTRLEKCINCYRNGWDGLISTDIQFVNSSSEVITSEWYDEAFKSIQGFETLSLALLNANFIMTTSNISFPRSVVDSGIKFESFRYAHDLFFFVQSIESGFPLKRLNDKLIAYRMHGSNTINESYFRVKAEWAYIIAYFVHNKLHFDSANLDFRYTALEIVRKHGLSDAISYILCHPEDLTSIPDFSTINLQSLFLKKLWEVCK